MSQSSPCWHALPPDEVLRELASSSDGLSEPEWRRRLAHYGPNRFRRTPPASVWRILVSQIRNVVVGLLVAGATVALLTGDCSTPPRSVRCSCSTSRSASRPSCVPTARWRPCSPSRWRGHACCGRAVARSGRARPRARRRHSSGGGPDGPGRRAAAGSHELRVVEASLTGEPAPVKKRADLGLAPDVRCPTESRWSTRRRPSAAGRGKAAVVATGMATEVGSHRGARRCGGGPQHAARAAARRPGPAARPAGARGGRARRAPRLWTGRSRSRS